MTEEEKKFSAKLLPLINSEFNEGDLEKIFGKRQERIKLLKRSATDYYDPFVGEMGQIRFYVTDIKITRITWVRSGENGFVWSPYRHKKYLESKGNL